MSGRDERGRLFGLEIDEPERNCRVGVRHGIAPSDGDGAAVVRGAAVGGRVDGDVVARGGRSGASGRDDGRSRFRFAAERLAREIKFRTAGNRIGLCRTIHAGVIDIVTRESRIGRARDNARLHAGGHPAYRGRCAALDGLRVGDEHDGRRVDLNAALRARVLAASRAGEAVRRRVGAGRRRCNGRRGAAGSLVAGREAGTGRARRVAARI